MSVLLDMSNFFLSAGQQMAKFVLPSHPRGYTQAPESWKLKEKPLNHYGRVMGDPQAPVAAKVYLQRAFKEFHGKFPQLHSDFWIDDLSFDVVDRNRNNTARVAIQAYEFVKAELEKDNLKLSPQKAGFVRRLAS